MSLDNAVLKTLFDSLTDSATTVTLEPSMLHYRLGDDEGQIFYKEVAGKYTLANGEQHVTVCPVTHRRLLLIGTEHGTVAVFEQSIGTKDTLLVLNAAGPNANNQPLNEYVPVTVDQLASLCGIEVEVTEVEETIIENTEEETMTNTTQTNETKTNRFTQCLNVAKRSGKYVAYAAGGLVVAGGAYAAYTALKGMGADTAAEAMGEAAGAAVSTAGEAVVETVAAWR